ncbi:hypothetical protein CVT24_001779 [Panaeolus cyanescens]|uniref:separase n=1 Tax=Panaeolus cyanescens TaxID=181874 RepID=A0A409YFP5_9AGAR|nr:hypothetical protein CVT24_001779 [Panaeolus cyanescens]
MVAILDTLSQGVQTLLALEKAELHNGSEYRHRIAACVEAVDSLKVSLLRHVGSSDGTLPRQIDHEGVDDVFHHLCSLAVRFLERPSPIIGIQDATVQLLDTCAAYLQALIETSRMNTANRDVDRALDILLALSWFQFECEVPSSYPGVRRYVSIAQEIANISCGLENRSWALDVLCRISQVNYNIGHTLVEAGQHNEAISFLLDSCETGARACFIQLEQKSVNCRVDLELYRRWELLGACYQKCSDMKNAHSAYLHAIFSYPFGALDPSCVTTPLTSPSCCVESDYLQDLQRIVNQATFIAYRELRLSPKCISLRSVWTTKPSTLVSASPILSQIGIPDEVLGHLMEQQLDFLNTNRSGHSIKPACACILADMLELQAFRKPTPLQAIQKSRVLLSADISKEEHIRFLLKYAKALAKFEDVSESPIVYEQAVKSFEKLVTAARMQSGSPPAALWEMSALASQASGWLQICEGNYSAALDDLWRALHFWRYSIEIAFQTYCSIRNVAPGPPVSAQPLDALEGQVQKQVFHAVRFLAIGFEWRLLDGLYATIFQLADIYFRCGSPNKANFLAKLAGSVSSQLNAPACLAQSLGLGAAVNFQLGNVQMAKEYIARARGALVENGGQKVWRLATLRLDLLEIEHGDQLTHSIEASFEKCEKAALLLDQWNFLPPMHTHEAHEPSGESVVGAAGDLDAELLFPTILAPILRNQLWSLRDTQGPSFDSVKKKLESASLTMRDKGEKDLLIARLMYYRTEKCIDAQNAHVAHDTVKALQNAEQLLHAYLTSPSNKDNTIGIRQAIYLLSSIYTAQLRLYGVQSMTAGVMITLLDVSVSLDLRHKMIEAIGYKIAKKPLLDDTGWPCLPPSASRVSNSYLLQSKLQGGGGPLNAFVSYRLKKPAIDGYWESLRTLYEGPLQNLTVPTDLQTGDLPHSWVVININISEDKSTLFLSRRNGGSSQPLLIPIPIDKGLRNQESVLDVLKENMANIISSMNTRIDGKAAMRDWVANLDKLDNQLCTLLDDIQSHLLGAFKACHWKRESEGKSFQPSQGFVANPRNGFYIVNPGGDLKQMEKDLQEWVRNMVKVGWKGVSRSPPKEEEFSRALEVKDLVVYFGHGGGEKYIKPQTIRRLPTCATTMLWGCSSGALKDMGAFDPIGHQQKP